MVLITFYSLICHTFENLFHLENLLQLYCDWNSHSLKFSHVLVKVLHLFLFYRTKVIQLTPEYFQREIKKVRVIEVKIIKNMIRGKQKSLRIIGRLNLLRV